MSTFEVLETHGTLALIRLVGTLALFVALHLLRLPFVVIAQVLAVAMCRVDAAAIRQASAPPRACTSWGFTPYRPR